MVANGKAVSINGSIGELDLKSDQIASSAIKEITKESILLQQILSLLENFKFQVDKYERLGYCDHELAYVSFSVSNLLIKHLQVKGNGATRKFIEELVQAVENHKHKFESMKALVSPLNRDIHELKEDELLKRFNSLRSIVNGLGDPSTLRFKDYQFRDSISPQCLNQFIRKTPERVLLLDFRSRKEYVYSHINFLNVVNIEPLFLSKMLDLNSELTDIDVESALRSRLDNFQFSLFKDRFKFDLVVIYNLRFGGISNDKFESLEYSILHCDGNGFPSQSPFKKLISLLVFQNKYISSRLKQYPVYLRGGLEKWHQVFGEGALTSQSGKNPTSCARDQNSRLNESESHKDSYLRSFGDYLASAKSYKHTAVSIPDSSSSSTKNLIVLDLLRYQKNTPMAENLDVNVERLQTQSTRGQASKIAHISKISAAGVGTEAPNPAQNESKKFLRLFTTGLANLGNSCYMNCILQCLSATPQLTNFFFPVIEVKNSESIQSYKQHINMKNHLGSKGVITTSFVKLLANMFNNNGKYFTPSLFKQTIGSLSPGGQFATGHQQDCIEFLNFILDSLHEDLNQRVVENAEERSTIMELSPEQERAREFMPVRLASTIEWERYLKLNFSVIVDYFQGQYLSQLRCLECELTSTTFNAFSTLSLPLPERLSKSVDKITLSQCLDLFTEVELLDDDNKWHCPRCQRFTKLTKKITITRLPKILIIHLKRFKMDSNGYFRKLENFVSYPVNLPLDLTAYWPIVGTYVSKNSSLAITKDREDQILSTFPDRNQSPPFKYQLYGVVNHFGNLTTGHYTAYVRKAKGMQMQWCYFDDARVQFDCKESQVLNKNAYCLFYLRI